MSCSCIYACVTSYCHSSKLKRAALDNNILIFLYRKVQEACIIIFLYVVDLYRSFVVPGSFDAGINRPSRIFECSLNRIPSRDSVFMYIYEGFSF